MITQIKQVGMDFPKKSIKSRFWSIDDIKLMKQIITEKMGMGKTRIEAMKAAAKHFNVTTNAVNIKYNRVCAGINSSYTKDTTKIPIVRKSNPTFKKNIKGKQLSEPQTFVFNITGIKVDLKNNKLIVTI
jgi:hypothetical protein